MSLQKPDTAFYGEISQREETVVPEPAPLAQVPVAETSNMNVAPIVAAQKAATMAPPPQ